MRDYDDYDDQSIRLYTPILQRVIILAAVVIAVPVLMWTITTFVRSYVARPSVPALEHLASTNTLSRLPAISSAPANPVPYPADQWAPPRAEGSAASEGANAAAESGNEPPGLAPLPEASPSPAAANSPSAVPLQAAPAPSPVLAATAATATSDAVAANPAPLSVASLPRASQVPSQPPSQIPPAPRSTDNSAMTSAPNSSDRGIAWPNPNSTTPPDFSAPRLSPPPPSPPPVRSAAAEVIAPDEPIRGPVPLPRHRPSILAMSTSGPAAGGPVPLPRVRPLDAPAEAATTVFEPPAGGRPDLENAH